jgi:hypothetical protein
MDVSAAELPDLLSSPEAAAMAAPYGVCAAIHPHDFIYHHHRKNPQRGALEAAGAYYQVGNDSATRLTQLLDRFMPAGELSIFEFAAGYGCVSRHLKGQPRFAVTPCDIHVDAVAFMRDYLQLPAIGSSASPATFAMDRSFDVVFALSFFTHMPARTWLPWFDQLFSLVREEGVFIFTTHGYKPWRDVGAPAVDAEGFWFAPMSEQQDLATSEYGCTISLPYYVFNRIRAVPEASLVYYEPDYWGGHQDTWVVRRRTARQVRWWHRLAKL